MARSPAAADGSAVTKVPAAELQSALAENVPSAWNWIV